MLKQTQNNIHIAWLVAMLAVVAGCGPQKGGGELEKPIKLGVTVGSLGRLYQRSAVSVRGYGIVAGLAGTGSSECPPALRPELVKYIWKQMPRNVSIDAGKFIDSRDTAVVEIVGVIPPLADRGDSFDVKVQAFSRSQTTSLAGGRLYTVELKEAASFVGFGPYMKSMATAQGPVYVDKLDGDTAKPREGYVLGGGTVSNGVSVLLALYEPNYYTAKAVRDQLQERFGPDTASAPSPSEIVINIPNKYRHDKERFLAMVQMVYLADSEASQLRKIKELVGELTTGDNKQATEMALDAIGRQTLDILVSLLDSKDDDVRFHAARCMLNVGDDRAIPALRAFANEPGSARRIPAIEAIGHAARREDAVAILTKLVANEDFDVRYAAYEQLRRLGDISVSQLFVAGEFFVESVISRGPKVVYVSRKDRPRIVLFGSPILCEENIFVETPQRDLMVNALPGARYVSVVRKHAAFPRPVGPLNCMYDVSDLVRTCCENLDVGNRPLVRQGLGASYCDVVVLLKEMCSVGAIKARFEAGPMTDVGKEL